MPAAQRRHTRCTGRCARFDLDAVAAAAGLDAATVRAAAENPTIKRTLAHATQEALNLGAVGVPTTVVDGALFWGDDRLDEAAARLATG